MTLIPKESLVYNNDDSILLFDPSGVALDWRPIHSTDMQSLRDWEQSNKHIEGFFIRFFREFRVLKFLIDPRQTQITKVFLIQKN